MRNILLSLVAIFAPFLIACTGQIEAIEIPTPRPPEPTPQPRALELPSDDASHSAPIEWWYYNGHLTSDDGEEFSFHFVIFQTQSEGSDNTFEFGQAGITDVSRRDHLPIISDRFASRQSAEDAKSENILGLNLGNFTLDIQPDGTHALQASEEATRTKIQLRTAAPDTVPYPAMLHNGIGWMEWPFGWTYYYSYPRMATEGTLTIEGREIDVAGEVWFDHQWGDFFVVGKPAGWQWFAVHLDDGRSLMVSEVRGADGEVIGVDGTLIDSSGQQRVLDANQDGIRLGVFDHWTSPHTGGEYPAKWRLRIESQSIDVMMSPTIADQEVPAMPMGNKAAAYWEGRIEIYDIDTGLQTGVAFAELSGYVEPEPLSWQDSVP